MQRIVYFLTMCVCIGLGSCRELFVKESPPVTLGEFSTADRNVYIGFTGTKVDASGAVQCRNFAYVKPSDSLLHLYGLTIPRTIASLLEVPVKRISLERDSLHNRFVEVRMTRTEGRVDMSSKDERVFLLKQLCEALNLNLVEQRIPATADFVVVLDETKLEPYRVQSDTAGVIRRTADHVYCENCQITSLANFLNANSPEEVLTRSTDSARFTITFNLPGHEDLAETLGAFGIGFEKGDTVLTMYTFR